eukprot:scaffold417941_cov41-Prasinocladus_malaysianus.AAC.1
MEALGSVVCDPGAQTTDSPVLAQMLQSAGSMGRPLFQLVTHPAGRVADGAALVMRAIAETGATTAAPMREAALREGAFLHHLNSAVFTRGGHRAQLSRDLVALWADDFHSAGVLLRRIFSPGLIRFLGAPRKEPANLSTAGGTSAGPKAAGDGVQAQGEWPRQGSGAMFAISSLIINGHEEGATEGHRLRISPLFTGCCMN